MKIKLKLFLALFAMAITSIAVNAQTVSGTVLDSDNFPVPNAEVKVKGSDASTVTDMDGNFTLDVPAGPGEIEIFTPNGTQSMNYNAGSGEEVAIGEINMNPSLNEVVIVGKGVIDIEEDRKTPVAVNTIFKDEIQEKAQGNVEFPEVLKNTPSVYVSNQAGGFGDSQMFTRGFDQSNTAFLLNGQPINGMEDGKMYWSNWSGMTDIANAVQIQRGLGSSKLAISSVGGTINIITKAAEKRRGGYVQGIVGNDSYFKFGAGYDTGLSDKGWAFSFSLSYWQAHRKYARGTAGEGQNYFLSLGKKINDRHLLNLLITGAPQWHDQNFSKEWDYGNGLGYYRFGNKWNPNAGFLNGDAYTWRKNYYHKPIINLNWDFDINERSNLSTVLYGSLGRGGGTGAFGNTRPFDVFRNEPTTLSYYNPSNGYFRFDEVVNQNSMVADGAGSFGNGVALRSSVNNHNWFGLVSNFNMKVNENFSFNIGFDGRLYKGDHFRQLVDLLGLSSYSDTYKRDPSLGENVVTATYKASPWAALFNYASEDERVAYDYSENINYFGGFGQAEYATDKFSIFVQGSYSTQSYQRHGRWADLGSSEKVHKPGYNIKGGIGYYINESNSIYGNAGHYSRQPFFDNLWNDSDGARYTNKLQEPSIENEKITGLEFGYKFSKSFFNVNLNLYHTTWDNRTITSFGTGEYIQDQGVKQEHSGFELDYNVRANSKFTLNGYFTYGNWNRVDGYTRKVFDDTTGDLISSEQVVLEKDEPVTEAPQFTTGLGFKYKFTNALSLDTDFSYYARNFDRFEDDGTSTLTPYALVDLGLTYKFKLGSQRLKFRGNVYNLFNSDYVGQADQYGYFFGNGRTWNMGVTANF